MGYNNSTTGEQMVIMAIRLAKRYNCHIVGQVHFNPEIVGGTVSFIVECHRLTYRYFYEDGRTTKLHNCEVTERDLRQYEQQFGTRKCLHEGFEKRYWFKDNWNGSIHYFTSLHKAKEAAKAQIGMTCSIYESQPYGRGGSIACFAPASGYMPP